MIALLAPITRALHLPRSAPRRRGPHYPEANVPALLEIRNRLVTERPADFDMEDWDRCVAGYTVRWADDLPTGPFREPSTSFRARWALGLNRGEAHDLFVAYAHSGGRPVTLRAAVRRLDRVIDGLEIDR